MDSATVVAGVPADFILEVPITQIKLDTVFNSRVLYERIPELAASIASSGQHTPVDVETTGDPKKPYKLLAGYRRYLAIQSGWADKSTPAPTIRVFLRKTKNEKDAFLLNLSENVARDALTSYEVARALVRLKDDYGLKPADISALMAAGKGYSRQNISNMIRCIKQLHPKILEAWAGGDDEKLPMHALYNWASLTHDEQLDEFAKIKGEIEPEGGEAGETDEKGAKKTGPKALRAVAIDEALKGVRAMVKAGDLEESTAAPVIATLKFVLRHKDSPAIMVGEEVIFDPRPEPEAENDDETEVA